MPQVRPASTWPGVVGIIALVLGIISLIGGLWGLVAPIFMNKMMTSMAGLNQPLYSHASTYIITGVSIVKCAMAVLLLYVGARILQRNPRVRKLVIRYSLLDIVVAVTASILMGYVQFETMQKTTSAMTAGGTTPLPTGGMSWSMAFAGMLIGTLFAIAFPVFLLIWFNRKAVQREIAEW